MKRLILFELIIIFLATTFESDSPPGWFQQVLPRTDIIHSDIFFLDSLTGWTTGRKNTNDTAFVFKTTNGGANWIEQFKMFAIFSEVQFLDANTGYIAGDLGFGAVFKTTNSGTNWNVILNSGDGYQNLFFVNKDTGWISDAFIGGAGLQKTTNCGLNWSQQLSGSFGPSKLFFINKDTGWAACQNTNLYRTTNGGGVWTLQHSFSQQINDIHFFNTNIGVVSSGFSHRTTDGGFNWVQTNLGGIKLSSGSDSIIWAGTNIFQKIVKSTNGGITWFHQTSPINNNSYTSAVDSLKAWAGYSGIVHTTDGGGPPVAIIQISSEVPINYKLYQNYPNPFNPVTNIKYNIMPNDKGQMSKVLLSVFDVTGKEVAKLVNEEQNAGTYLADWNASGYASGIYFYSLIVDGNLKDTKRMVLIK